VRLLSIIKTVLLLGLPLCLSYCGLLALDRGAKV